MPTNTTDFDNLVRIILNANASADQKKVAAATIALCLIDSQAQGGTLAASALADTFAAGGEFERAVGEIKARIAAL